MRPSFSENTNWKKIAIGHDLDRYVLNLSVYGLPYFEVKFYETGDSHIVTYIEPGDYIGLKKEKRQVVDHSSRYHPGPYHNPIKAIREESRKLGLPSEIEGG